MDVDNLDDGASHGSSRLRLIAAWSHDSMSILVYWNFCTSTGICSSTQTMAGVVWSVPTLRMPGENSKQIFYSITGQPTLAIASSLARETLSMGMSLLPPPTGVPPTSEVMLGVSTILVLGKPSLSNPVRAFCFYSLSWDCILWFLCVFS